jgi:hypothetical protein
MSAASRSGRGIVNVSSKVVRNRAASVNGNFVSSSATGVARPIGHPPTRAPSVVMFLCRQCDSGDLVQPQVPPIFHCGMRRAVSAADITGPLIERVCLPGWGQGHPASRHLPPATLAGPCFRKRPDERSQPSALLDPRPRNRRPTFQLTSVRSLVSAGTPVSI